MQSPTLTYMYPRSNPVYLIKDKADISDPAKVPTSAEAGTFVYHIATGTTYIKETDGSFSEHTLTPALFALMF